jgi:hypothetical protein
VKAPLVVLEPGDQVLVVLPEATERELTDRLHTELRRRFPGVTFGVLSGASQVIVQPAEDGAA